MNSVLKYPGAKTRLSDWICGYMPPHKVYLELYCGSAAVLLNKPRSHIETINDIDGEVVNFFRVLRDNPQALSCLIRYTPYAREEYGRAYEQTDDPVERARRYCVRCWMGFGAGQVYKNGFKTGQQSKSQNPARLWSRLPDIVLEAAERLKGVQIEQLPALELLRRYNTPDVFVYADPPYWPGTRKRYLYKHEMSEQDHIDLLSALLSHPGPVMLSGYNNDVYNAYLRGWRKINKVTQAEHGLKREEILWLNYDTGQMGFDTKTGVMQDV